MDNGVQPVLALVQRLLHQLQLLHRRLPVRQFRQHHPTLVQRPPQLLLGHVPLHHGQLQIPVFVAELLRIRYRHQLRRQRNHHHRRQNRKPRRYRFERS